MNKKQKKKLKSNVIWLDATNIIDDPLSPESINTKHFLKWFESKVKTYHENEFELFKARKCFLKGDGFRDNPKVGYISDDNQNNNK